MRIHKDVVREPMAAALSNRDLNIHRNVCDASNDQSKPIQNLTHTTAQLERDLHSIEARIETRLRAIANGSDFRDPSTDVVDEFNQLKEDRFWRAEIETRLTEHLDELAGRKMLRDEKLQSIQNSTESSPAKRDATYAHNLVQQEREEQRATRQRNDQDELSAIMAKCLQNEEKKIQMEENNDSKTKSMIGRLMNKLRRNGGKKKK